MNIKTIKLKVNEYGFGKNNNPYEINDKQQPVSLSKVANKISESIDSLNTNKLSILVRGIQSGKHKATTDQLLERILKDGVELEDVKKPNTIFAAPYHNEGTILQILEGFHKYKPKCEERPQYIVDIWMVFKLDAYDNIEYLHPRHKVIARDKWKRKSPENTGLIGVVIINKGA